MTEAQRLAQQRRRARERGETERRLKPSARLDDGDDQDMFEAVMFAFLDSDLEPDCWEPGGAAGFAALLVRVAEQTVAEFGRTASAQAFRAIADIVAPRDDG